MGDAWDKSAIGKEEVLAAINKINEIFNKNAVMEFFGLNLNFYLDKDKHFQKKILIQATVKNYDPNLQTIGKQAKKVDLTIEEFYNYYNSLMSSLPIFYEQKLERTYSIMGKKERERLGSEDTSSCPICEENKVDVSLPCHHFFCEECIKAWVIKSETCPLCRLKLKFNKYDKSPAGISGSNKWDVLSKDEEMNQESKRDSIDTVLKLTNKLFTKK